VSLDRMVLRRPLNPLGFGRRTVLVTFGFVVTLGFGRPAVARGDLLVV
jgi:hypothetical protein